MKQSFLLIILISFFVLLHLSSCDRYVGQENKCNFEESYRLGKKFSIEGKTDSAIFFFTEALDCNGPADSNLRLLLELGDLYRLQSDFLKAEKIIFRFDSLYLTQDKKDSSLIAEKLHLKGKIATNKGSYNDALRYFHESIELKNRVFGRHQLIHAKTFNFIGIVYLYQNQYKHALDFFDSSLLICETHGVFEKDASDSFMNKGIVYSILGRYEDAINNFNHSRRIQEVNPLKYRDLGEFYINYGHFLKSVGESSESIEMYEKAENLLKHDLRSKNISMTHLYINLGNAYYQRGDYDKARVYYSNTIRELEDKVEENHPSLVMVRNNLAFMHFIVGEYHAAEDLFRKNLNQKINSETRVFLLRNLAKVIEALGDKIEAENLFLNALVESRGNLGENHQETSVSFQSLGELYIRQSRHDEAILMLESAMKIMVNNYSAQRTSINHLKVLIAKALTMKSDYQAAESIFLEATKGFNPESEQSFLDADVRIKEAFFGLAALYYLRSKANSDTLLLKKSLGNYLTGLKIVEKLGMTIADESRLLLNQENRRRMAEALSVCHYLYVATGDESYLDLAFDLSSKSKGAVLLSSIRHNKALEFGGVPNEVTLKENSLREEISVVRKLIYNEKLKKQPSHTQLGYLENKLFVLDKMYDSLTEHIEVQYPSYFRLKYQSNLIPLQKVQQELSNNQILLDYSIYDSTVFLIALTNKEKLFRRLEGIKDPETSVNELLNYLKPDFSNLTGNEYRRFAELSHELYDFLIGPVDQLTEEKHIMVIPDGILGYIPFEVLITELPDTSLNLDYTTLPYLLKTNSVSYIYSATLRYMEQNDKDSIHKGRVLTFVPDYSDIRYQQQQSVADDEVRQDLVPLPYARLESKHVLSIVDGKELKGERASKLNFVSMANDFDVLHLAMHTQISDNNPLYSRLVFHPLPDSLDSYSLSTYELYNLRLNARLVVLSACNTGSGSLRQGEGIMSLSRGFVYAGVPSIVMTTWEVHDESGSRLMERFYFYLREGLGKDEALRKAKLDFLEGSNRLKAHPYFWSSYVLIGNPDPISLEASERDYKNFVYAGILLLVILITGVFILKKRTTASS